MELPLTLVLLSGCAFGFTHGHALQLREFRPYKHLTDMIQFQSSRFSASGVQRCELMDDSCLLRGVEFVLKNYAKSGIKELGLIPLDPLHINKFQIGRNPHSPVNIDLSFRDVDLLGLGDAIPRRVG